MEVTDGDLTFQLPWTGVIPRRGDYIIAQGMFQDEFGTISGKIDKILWDYTKGTHYSITIFVLKDY